MVRPKDQISRKTVVTKDSNEENFLEILLLLDPDKGCS